jgi:hypothetical protein
MPTWLPRGTITGMAKKPSDDSPAHLSLVGAEGDSSRLTGRAKRLEALERGRIKAAETRARRKAEREALLASGVRSPLERYRDGEYPIKDWSDEEVRRGRPANVDGTFTGAWPKLSGKEHAVLKRELLTRGQHKIDAMYMDVLEVLHDVALNGEKDADRVKAADLLVQRAAGKVPERIEIKSSDPWQDILDDVLADDVLQRVSTEQHDHSA